MGDNFNYPLFEMVAADYNKKGTTQVTYNDNKIRLTSSSFLLKSTDFVSGIKCYCHEGSGNEFVCMPLAVGAVVIAYNLPGIDDLKLNASTLSKLFRGEITEWNHPDLVRLNPKLAHYDQPITLLFRADGSSSTYLFSQYLSDADSTWAREMGLASSIQFKHGIGFIENESTSLNISKIPGSISYTSAEYAELAYLSTAWIENPSGRFLKPTKESLVAAIPLVLPDKGEIALCNSPDENAYPIAGFSRLMIPQKHYDKMSPKKQKELIAFLKYLISPDAQERVILTHFAPLTTPALNEAIKTIKKLENNEKQR